MKTFSDKQKHNSFLANLHYKKKENMQQKESNIKQQLRSTKRKYDKIRIDKSKNIFILSNFYLLQRIAVQSKNNGMYIIVK